MGQPRECARNQPTLRRAKKRKVRTKGTGMSKPCGGSHLKLNKELLYDPAIPLVGIDSKALNTGTEIRTCTRVPITAFFTKGKK